MDAEVDWGMEDDFDPWQAGSAPQEKSQQTKEVKEEQEKPSAVEAPPKATEKPSQSRCSLLRVEASHTHPLSFNIAEEEPKIKIEQKNEQIRTASRDSSAAFLRVMVNVSAITIRP
jgi:hypothetical protein